MASEQIVAELSFASEIGGPSNEVRVLQHRVDFLSFMKAFMAAYMVSLLLI
jgi:hypothetical protein